MGLRKSKAIMFVTEPPEFSYIDGMFHVRQHYTDKMFVERVMRPHTFFLALRRAAECAKLHRLGGAAIIDFPAKDEEAASA